MNQMDPILTTQLLLAERERRAHDARRHASRTPRRRLRSRWLDWRAARAAAAARRWRRPLSALWPLRGLDECPTCR